MARCHVRVRKLESTEIKPRVRDFFVFFVTATLRCPPVTNATTMFVTLMYINCEILFQGNVDLIQSQLRVLQDFPLFTSECIDQIAQRVVYLSRRLFHCENESLSPNDPGSADSEHQYLPLALDIFVDIDQEIDAMYQMLYYMHQRVAMIPASKEAIESLQTFNLPHKCNICMDKFHENDDEDAKLSLMPCAHIFHHHCIVKWLQTSHTCPVCRYAMATIKDGSRL